MGEQPPNETTPDILNDYDIAFNKMWAPDIDFVITNIPILAKIPGKYKRAVDRLNNAREAAEELVYFSPRVREVSYLVF